MNINMSSVISRIKNYCYVGDKVIWQCFWKTYSSFQVKRKKYFDSQGFRYFINLLINTFSCKTTSNKGQIEVLILDSRLLYGLYGMWSSIKITFNGLSVCISSRQSSDSSVHLTTLKCLGSWALHCTMTAELLLLSPWLTR